MGGGGYGQPPAYGMQQPQMQQPPSMGMPPQMQQPPPQMQQAPPQMQQPPPQMQQAPPQMQQPPQGMGMAPQGAGGMPPLAAYYAGQRVAVNKDRFIIGRGKQSSDLTIKDPNVSRQHAMVEFLNGQFYMVDMGSTNGVEYNGQRISRKAIAEGDLFRICDHEVRFSYR